MLTLMFLLGCSDKPADTATTATDTTSTDTTSTDTTSTDTGVSCEPTAETCDGLDEDCDGVVDEVMSFVDEDGDGFGVDETGAAWDCTKGNPPAPYTYTGGDCDDEDPALNPETFWFEDQDGDSYGVAMAAVIQCDPGPGWAIALGDCDDSRYWVYPGAVELCDALDNDCDDIADESENLKIIWYFDADFDGFGDENSPNETCSPIAGELPIGEDCDDANAEINPDADEVCGNSADDDCDEVTDEEVCF